MVTPDKVNEDSTLGKYDLYFTGWSLGPDPDFQLSINTCDSRPNADGSGNTSENNWCSPEFDQLFKAQHAELDKAQAGRAGEGGVHHRSTRRTSATRSTTSSRSRPTAATRSMGFVTQPEKSGVILNQNGYWGLYSAELVSADAADDGSTPGWLIPAVVVVVLLGAGGFVVARRRGGAAEDRE